MMVKKNVFTDTNTKQAARLKRPLIKPYWIFPLFILALVTGMLGGWVRMGWEISMPAAAGYHGLLMTGGFLGGLITLERTMTMEKRSWLTFPAASGLSILFLLIGFPKMGGTLLIISSIGLISFYLIQLNKYSEKYWYILLAGAVCWLLGNIRFMLTEFVAASVHWWVGFILFTILGERLELTRFLPVKKIAKTLLWGLLGIAFLGLLISFHGYGKLVYGISGLLATLWFIRNDMARHNVKKPGYHRYTGVGILTGYFWLILHLLTTLFFMERTTGYDIYVHTFFLGFAFSMIWAHAPIILPAVLGLKVRPYHSIIWFFWSVFQLSLLMRIVVSFMQLSSLKLVAGVINGISILLMFAVMGIIMKMMLVRAEAKH